MNRKKPKKCEGCEVPDEALRLTIGGWLCGACERICRADAAPALPPTRKDIPPESRMRNLPSGSGPTYLTTLFIDRSPRGLRG
jgi:hypothetical protein